MAEDDVPLEFLLNSLQTSAILEQVVKEWLPIETRQRLDAVVEHWREPLDESLIRLTPEGDSRKDWLDILREASQSVRDGLTACHYHVARIRVIENEIVGFCEERGEMFREGHDVSFRIPALSAEYAALQFALRRTLDYMAIAVGSFFKTEGRSFRRLDRVIHEKEPEEISRAVRERLHEAGLSSILGTPEGHSVRDQLAHHRAVENAWFGVQRVRGQLRIRYSSEVEDIKMNEDVESENFLTTPLKGRDLSEAVAGKLALVEKVVFELYEDMGLLGVEA